MRANRLARFLIACFCLAFVLAISATPPRVCEGTGAKCFVKSCHSPFTDDSGQYSCGEITETAYKICLAAEAGTCTDEQVVCATVKVYLGGVCNANNQCPHTWFEHDSVIKTTGCKPPAGPPPK